MPPRPPIARIEISFLANLQILSDIRDVLTQALAAAGVRTDDRFRLLTAVDELSSNIARYGYPPKTLGTIDLALSVEDRQIELQIADRGPRFDPRGGKLPAWHLQVTRGRTGGMGRYLVSKMA